MATDTSAIDELGDVLRELVSELELTTSTIQQGMTTLTSALEGGTADALFAELAEFAFRAASAAQRYAQLQMEWMLAGY